MREDVAQVDDLKELQKTLTDLRLEMRELVTEVRGLKDMQKEFDTTKQTAGKAKDRAEEAHVRMDKIERIHWWLFTTIGGTAIVAVIAFALKGGLVK